jgi:two-component system cell cycle response regulator DivK
MTGQTVLIVEDNPTNRKLIEVLLRRTGYRLLSAESAEKGLEIAYQEKPDLILMDIVLPQMSGIEATRLLRANPLTSQTTIVALTATPFADERDAALSAGCSGCIMKPVDIQLFASQVQSYLSQIPDSQ